MTSGHSWGLVPVNARWTIRLRRGTYTYRAIGPDAVILSSDLGQAGNALPPDGLAVFIEMLRKNGFTDSELDLMTRKNPAKLLGLPPLMEAQ